MRVVVSGTNVVATAALEHMLRVRKLRARHVAACDLARGCEGQLLLYCPLRWDAEAKRKLARLARDAGADVFVFSDDARKELVRADILAAGAADVFCVEDAGLREAIVKAERWLRRESRNAVQIAALRLEFGTLRLVHAGRCAKLSADQARLLWRLYCSSAASDGGGVPTTELAAELGTCDASIRNQIWKLRRVIEEQLGHPPVILSSAGGYHLKVD